MLYRRSRRRDLLPLFAVWRWEAEMFFPLFRVWRWPVWALGLLVLIVMGVYVLQWNATHF